MFTVKGAIGTVLEWGVGAVIGTVVKNNSNEDMKTGDKVLISIGTIGLSMLAGSAVRNTFNKQYDEIHEDFKDIINDVQEDEEA